MSQHHDPVHPDSEHLTPEVLADLSLGLLDADSAAHAQHHLAQCPACTALQGDFAALAELLGSLQSLPGTTTEPMPDAVWQQLEQALATEPVITPEGAATVVPLQARRDRRMRRPGIGAVVAVAGLALVGAVAVPNLLNLNSGGDDSGGGLASDSADSTGDQSTESGPVTAADFVATRSGTAYDEQRLSSQVTELVSQRVALQADGGRGLTSSDEALTPSPTASDEESGEGGVEGEDEVKGTTVRVAPLATSPAAAQACLEGYLDASGVAPLAIDIGTWDGRPAAIIVLPDEADPTLAVVWVIDPQCDNTGAEDPLIYFATISR